MLAAVGCGFSFFGWPPPSTTVESLEDAQELALAKAQDWDATARLVGLTCVWVDQDGVLTEPADGPGWAFQYVNDAGTLQVGVTVQPNGAVDASDPVPLGEPAVRTLSAHSTQDIEDYIDAAQAELLRAPEGKGLVTATEDFAVIVGFNQEDGSEDAVVLFHEEDDQGTDWADFNWFTLFQDADAYVFLDTADNTVETNSWEMSLERALRIARQSVADDSHLIGILAVWIDENGKLHEPGDAPGWGFQFTNGDGTERIGVTVETDGNTIVSEPTVLDTPITQELTDHVADDIEDYVAVALAELANAPQELQPQT